MLLLSPVVAANFAHFAYSSQEIFNGIEVKLPLEIRPDFKLLDTSIGGVTGGHIFKKITGMVVLAESRLPAYKDHLIIAFRGTNPRLANDVLTDLYVSRGVSHSKKIVHGGFLKCFDSMKSELHSQVLKKRPRCIHIIGHSLGGALATLCADYLRSHFGTDINLYTFASPRVGVSAFANAMNTSGVDIHRLSHSQDPVTIVPIWPFVHTGPEYLFAGSRYDLLNAKAHDIKNYVDLAGTHSSYHAMAKGQQTLITHEDVVLHYDERFHIKCDKASEVLINSAIHTLLKGSGFVGYASLQHGTMAITTMYDLIAKHMANIAAAAKDRAEQVKGILGCILVFVGRGGESIKELSYAVIKRIFNYMLDKLRDLARQALNINR